MHTNTTQETSKNGAAKASTPGREPAPPRVHVPPVDVLESTEEILVLADLPGVRTEDVTIHLDKALLSLVAERKGPSPERAVQYKRTFQVPNDVDPERIEAKSDNGVLTLRFPRRSSAKPRTIAVKTGV